MSRANCCECRYKDGSLFDALESIVWYDGHYVWLKELRNDMFSHIEERHYSSPIELEDWHSEKHTIWMLLVGMFGDWGTSIRGGWIESVAECIEFIDAVCKDSWEHEMEDV